MTGKDLLRNIINNEPEACVKRVYVVMEHEDGRFSVAFNDHRHGLHLAARAMDEEARRHPLTNRHET